MNGMAASDKIFAVLDLSEPEFSSQAPKERTEDQSKNVNTGFQKENSGDLSERRNSLLKKKTGQQVKIQFRNVHFSYEKDREILSGIDLDMPSGMFISLVGESGCGKSTVAGILAGRNRGFTGSVTVNNLSLIHI